MSVMFLGFDEVKRVQSVDTYKADAQALTSGCNNLQKLSRRDHFFDECSIFQTIFELNVGHKSQSVAVMKEKRRQHQERIRAVKEEKARMEEALKSEELSHLPSERAAAVESADEAAIVSEISCESTNIVYTEGLCEALIS